jgi:hypothetical protein
MARTRRETEASTQHACEVEQLPEPYSVVCHEVGVIVLHDRLGFEHWVCRWHDSDVRAYLDRFGGIA